MSQWSMPIQPPPQGWKLRVLSGRMLGSEFDLPNRRYILGSQQPSDIVIAHPDIAPQHVAIELSPNGVRLMDMSNGRGVVVNGSRRKNADVAPGDHIEVGPLKFEFSNPNYQPPVKPGSAHPMWTWIEQRPLWQRVGGVLLGIALLLFWMLTCSGALTLVPVTMVMAAAVVPVTVICWLVEQYDIKRYSFYTLTITFLGGGTIGVIAAMFGFLTQEMVTFGLFFHSAIFAGFIEEPAKLLGTAWRWRHPGYDRPMDGLILGAVSGFGFAVMETAGYGLQMLFGEPEETGDEFLRHMMDLPHQIGHFGGLSGALLTLAMRSVMAPFAHGLWSGILGAAFWASGRNWSRALQSREFWASAGIAVGLHAIWNFDLIELWLLPCFVSAVLSTYIFRQLWKRKGYFSLEPSFWQR